MYNVAIIGAGINGVTTAYALNQAGVDNVVVLEAHRYPSMETSYASGGLDRHPVTPSEIRTIEPALKGEYYGGMYTPSDASGDIHKFTRRLASVCEARGTTFLCETEVGSIVPNGSHFELSCRPTGGVCSGRTGQWGTIVEARKLVICAGTHSRSLASMLSDRINIYPVKGYSVTCHMEDEYSRANAPVVSLLDEEAKIVTSRLGSDRFRVAGTAELNGFNYDIRADRIEPLKRWIRSNFPAINTSRIVSWAGLRPMMPNMMPVVRAGRRANVFYNTGHGHLGWTLSAATADLVVQLVKG
ncbi:MAG TPA: FAD-dependent oxidoreductase [Pseudolabrys sp.]|nr:FAD-dependent oxidoreductase [Pseudolabrys sp.]